MSNTSPWVPRATPNNGSGNPMALAGRLPGLGKLPAPQSASREAEGEERGHADCEERPDEEVVPPGPGDLVDDNGTRQYGVAAGHANSDELYAEHDNVNRRL